MDSKFSPQDSEKKIYEFWEKRGLLQPKNGTPFTILMPPPNANASLHAGHGMYTADDVMIRYKRLLGYASLWIPGMDHAGFETQYVYEKYLTKKGQSRMDFDRETLYKNISEFVQENSGLIYIQFKRLGFLADWERSVFTLDDHVLQRVFQTFQKMESETLVYRNDYIVNYCAHCGTSLSELEIKHIERKDLLYYLKYGPFVLATVRPETKFGDTAVAVHPKDKRYTKWIGKEIEVQGLLGKFRMKVIGDTMVDPKFGTGVVKITPAHDPNDFETGKRHNLEIKKVIDIDGRLNEMAGPYAGLKIKQAREKVVEDLKKLNLIEKIDDNYTHSVAVCYRCGRDLEPTVIPNWFIRVAELKKPVIKIIEEEKIKFYPKRFKKQILQWLTAMHDWPISRQIVWGIRIPVWYDAEKNPSLYAVFLDSKKQSVKGTIQELLKQHSFSEIEKGLQKITAPIDARYVVSDTKPGQNFLQETDTFDTWFSSGQWPLVTLKENEYKIRFPTDVMGTLSDILPLWVSRMILFSLYIRKEIPFKNVYLWSMVADAKGQKMSKSKGNVINPIDIVDRYGADAFRSALFFGVSPGGKVNLAEEKFIAMRNFGNKMWNIGRFLELNSKLETRNLKQTSNSPITNLKKEFEIEKKKYFRYMDSYRFSMAFETLYQFTWHRYADYFVEQLKEELRNGNIEALNVLKDVYFENLKMMHPFMPFVTEAIWQIFHGQGKSILNEKL